MLADGSSSPSGRGGSTGRGDRSGRSGPTGSLRVVSFERGAAPTAGNGGRGARPGRRRGGTIGDGWMLRLSDGSSFFVPEECLRESEVEAAQLTAGELLAPSSARALEDCSRAVGARRKAMELLARRAHSVQELRLKLLQRGFEPGHVEPALAWLGQRGLLDDTAFARAWVQRRADRHPEGPPVLAAGLRRRGVSREIAELAVADLCGREGERALAEAALAGLLRRRGPGAGEDAIRKALQRRGFRSSVIIELLRERRAGASG